MPVVVIAKEPDDFKTWLDNQQAEFQAKREQEQRLLAMQLPKEELMELGKRTYDQFCAACHQPNGQGLPGMFPSLKGSDMVLNDAAGHIDIVLYGKAGTAMAGYAKQLSLKELAAVVTYERNAWGNDTGELIQAADIEARKNAAM